ncbi:MAG: hypothetical protein QM654_04105 [Dysgonamonadaceae bacterium]
MTKCTFLLFLLFLVLQSCDNEGKKDAIRVPYDPSKPVEITKFLPDSARFLDDFVITGSNFGTDISKIQVLFKDNTRKATVLGSDGNTIYGLVPKQPGGKNSVTLVLNETDTIDLVQKVNYKQFTMTTVLSGIKTDRKHVDGTLSEGRFQSSVGCAFVAENNLIVSETHQRRIRLVSEKDNSVITLLEGFCAGKPAINKAGDRAYFIGLFANSHIVYEFLRENLWSPRKIRATTITLSTEEVWNCALDDSEEWLYFVDLAGKMIRMNLRDTENTELVMNGIFTTQGGQLLSTWRPYIVWSPVDKCFFVSSGQNESLSVIYRIWNEDGVWKKEIYAGKLGNPGMNNGHRLDEALIRQPLGMVVDSEGNLYFADSINRRFRKIDRLTGMITTVAGSGKADAVIGSDPLTETSFWMPHDITADSEDNFILADELEGWWIKLAIE